jgi:hypothetical protein
VRSRVTALVPAAIATIVAVVTTAVISPAFAQRAPAVDADELSASYAPDVLAAARRDYMAIRVCYDATPRAALDHIRSLTLFLETSGAVRDVRIDSPAPREIRRFRTCLAPIVRAWRLPAPPSHAPVQITYAFDELRHGVEGSHP